MALLNFKCDCGKTKRIFADTTDSKVAVFSIPVCECGRIMVRDAKGPSTQLIEKLDNGAMVKSLERYADAEQLFRDRHQNADELAGTKPNRS
jgi:hypothetical protein